MNHEHHRRSSYLPQPTVVPPAPPLPPQPYYTQQAKNALHRVFGFGIKVQDEPSSLKRNLIRLPSLTSSNASASHRTGLELNALSINDTGTHALLAGREIFKTVRVDEGVCTEDANIRAAIRTYDASVSENISSNARPRDPAPIHDVAWAKGTTGNFVAAATSNGVVILYDLNRLGIEIARLFDHRRQVHRVTFNPHAGYYMLSASQDGTVRMWDIRDHQRKASTFTSNWSIPGQTDGIRDVKWSPTDGTEYALGTDSGWIQKWDTRNTKVAKLKIAAHSAMCNTIDWHPDGKHLLSASADKTVRVWNMSAEGRRHKPTSEIKTPFPLRNARWRPPCQSGMPGDEGARQCTQIVTSYDKEYPMVHVWDLRRPALPFREIECYNTAPTDLLWHSQDLLWTVGREGAFLQTDVKYVRKVLDKRNMQAFALSPSGEIDVITQRRSMRRQVSLTSSEGGSRQYSTLDMSKFDKQTQERMSRGSADDTLDETFLSARMKYSRPRSAVGRDSRSTGGTPQPSDRFGERTLRLDQILNRRKSFRPGQLAARGTVPGSAQPLLITYFAQKYKIRAFSQPITVEDLLNIEDVFSQNAHYAQLASMHRIAQSWKIAGKILSRELLHRADQQRSIRARMRAKKIFVTTGDSSITRRARILLEHHREQISKPSTPVARPISSLGNDHLSQKETSSNVPTPLARPVGTSDMHGSLQVPLPLPDLGEDASLSLPPSIVFSATQSSRETDGTGENSNAGLVGNGGNTPAHGWHAPSRQPLSLEPNDNHGVDSTLKLTKHNSDESFEVFPSMSSSRRPSLPESLASSKTHLMKLVQEELSTSDAQRMSSTTSNSSEDESPRVTINVDPQEVSVEKSSLASDVSADSLPLVRNVTSDGTTGSQGVQQYPISQDRPASRRAVTHDIQILTRNNQESFSSVTEVRSSSSMRSIKDEGFRTQEARGTNGLDAQSSQRRSREISLTEPTSLFHQTESGPSALDGNDRHDSFVVADFFVKADSAHPVAEESSFTLLRMLKELLAYHTRTLSDSQTASVLLLLLSPLLPEIQPLPQAETDTTLNYYLDHLSSLNLSDDAMLFILSTGTSHMMSSGIQPLYAEAILSDYHERLVSLSLSNNAAYLRRMTYPTYPSVYEQGLKENQIFFRCGGCKKPINNARDKLFCESCGRKQKPCPICWCSASPFDAAKKKKRRQESQKASSDPSHGTQNNQKGHGEPEDIDGTAKKRAVLYTTCLSCNHSAHAACLDIWHGTDNIGLPAAGESGGVCPIEGCGCSCINGDRVEHNRQEPLKSQPGKKGLRDDEMVVAESKAVSAVRRSLSGRARGSVESLR